MDFVNDLETNCASYLKACSSSYSSSSSSSSCSLSSSSSSSKKIRDEFKLPIWYNAGKKQVDESLITNLELINRVEDMKKSGNNVDNDNNDNNLDDHTNLDDDNDFAKTIYQKVFCPKTTWGNDVLTELGTMYTEDIDFLKDTQELIQTPLFDTHQVDHDQKKVDSICDIWKDIKNNPNFLYTFHYMDFPMLNFLNESETFLLVSSLYHLSSPIISLLVPVIVLVLPFFIILQMGEDVSLTFSEYLNILFQVIENHAIGKLFTQFHAVNLDEKIYLLISVFFYFFSFYQNILLCLSFHSTLQKVHEYIATLATYLEACETKMRAYLDLFVNDTIMLTYKPFNLVLKGKLLDIQHFRLQLQCISAYCFSTKKIGELGNILKLFYMIYDDPRVENMFLFTFGFNGFLELFSSIRQRVIDGKMEFVSSFFKKDENEKVVATNLTDMFYPGIIDDKYVVKNNLDLEKNIILTGPNASGKTTLLKAGMINMLLAQQIGCGCFGKGSNLKVVTDFHCYLNIIDNMGRDSLFQSESKRCKSIITKVKMGENEIYKNHFCIFDEIFSGTNPNEAVKCAYGFLTYLTKFDSVKFMLTTHYMDICKKVEDSGTTDILNYRMNVLRSVESDDLKKDVQAEVLEYTYGLEKGVNPVDGGVAILRQLDYPADIMEIIASL